MTEMFPQHGSITEHSDSFSFSSPTGFPPAGIAGLPDPCGFHHRIIEKHSNQIVCVLFGRRINLYNRASIICDPKRDDRSNVVTID